MWNARQDDSQPGIKIAGRNINKLRYADDTTLMAENEEELSSLLMKVKELSKKKLNIQKTKIMASSPIISWQIEGKKVEAVSHFIFLGFKITEIPWNPGNSKTLTPWKESYDKSREHIKK